MILSDRDSFAVCTRIIQCMIFMSYQRHLGILELTLTCQNMHCAGHGDALNPPRVNVEGPSGLPGNTVELSEKCQARKDKVYGSQHALDTGLPCAGSL